MKRAFTIIWLCIGIVMFRVSDSFGQPKPGRISLRGTAGVGYVPLKAWGELVDDGWGDYRKERFGSYWDIGVVYGITERHSVVLTVGGIQTSASNRISGSSYTSIIEWDFRTTPIGVTYEFRPTSQSRSFFPFVGVGTSYLITEIKAKSTWTGPPYGQEIGIVSTMERVMDFKHTSVCKLR